MTEKTYYLRNSTKSKTMKRILLCFLIALSISSCTIKEKVTINEDGSGSFSYGFDMAGMYKMGMKSSDTVKNNKVIDTTFNFKELFNKAKDSIAKLPPAEKEMLKVLENFKISLKVNQEKKQMEYNMAFDFPNLDSIQKMASPTQAMEKLALSDRKNLGALSAAPKSESTNLASFLYDGKVFVKSITSSKENKKTPPKAKAKKKEKEENDPFSKKMEEMLKECKYSMEYHFPKKIKTVSLKNAVIAADKKSFVYDVPLENMQDNSNMEIGFKVIFED